MNHVRITGAGSYAPDKIVLNSEIEKMLRLEEGWIEERTGISERRWGEENIFSMAAKAAVAALKDANVEDFDTMLIGRARNPEPESLTIAGTVHFLLQKEGYRLRDVDYADGFYLCSGSVTALHEADLRLKAGESRRCLVVAASHQSRFVSPEHRGTACLWGDGAGAFVLEASEKPGIIYYKGKGIPDLWDATPLSIDSHGKNYVKMDGSKVYRSIVDAVPLFVREFVHETGIELKDVTYFILHQANKRIMEEIMHRIEQPFEKCLTTIEKFGNTSAASPLITYDMAKRQQRIKENDLILFIGYGLGGHENCLLYKV